MKVYESPTKMQVFESPTKKEANDMIETTLKKHPDDESISMTVYSSPMKNAPPVEMKVYESP